MKRLFVLLLFIIGMNCAFAADEITFIYLNSSNINTEKTKEDFIKGA